MHIHPPSTVRLMPFIASFSSRKRDAPTTSAIVTRRPIGVRCYQGLPALGRHVGPLRAVADDGRMQRVHAHRGELDDERAHKARHSSVDRRDGRRPGVGPVARKTAEDEDRGVLAQPRQQRVDHLRVPDELQRDQPQGGVDVVLAHRVHVTLDGGEHEVVDVAHVGASGPRSNADRRGRTRGRACCLRSRPRPPRHEPGPCRSR